MQNYPITVDEARGLYEKGGGGHDFDHVLRVTMLAEQIGRVEGADLTIVRTAALLHDVGESEERENHHLRSAVMARELLRSEQPAFVNAVAHAIEAHRFRATLVPQTLEARVLFDADKLDAIGAIGIGRAFAYAGARGTALWRQSQREIAAAAGDAVSQPAALGAAYTPVHEYIYKLDRIPELLYTATARGMATERRAFMREFFAQLDEEMVGRK